MVERYTQLSGKDIKIKTIDETRLSGSSYPKGYVLKVQADGSVVYEPFMVHDPELRLFLFEG